jgi:hypothetical protein
MKATMFLRRPVPLIAPHPKIGLGSVRQKDLPCGFEIGAGLVEGGCRAAMVFAGGRARIEAAVPLPWIGIVRVAGAGAIVPTCTSPKIDMPAFFAGTGRTAAGEGGHVISDRQRAIAGPVGPLPPQVFGTSFRALLLFLLVLNSPTSSFA